MSLSVSDVGNEVVGAVRCLSLKFVLWSDFSPVFYYGQGLEKYLMTKLFARAFAPVPEEVEHDQRLSEKMGMLQQFIRPEHLDIPPSFQNESSWLVCNYPFSLSLLILSKKLDSLRGILSSLSTFSRLVFCGFIFCLP
jgi:hypothetical protein